MKKNNKSRKLGTQGLAIRLILLVSTVVLMGIGTTKLLKINAQILSSQYKMYSFYTRINGFEKERDHNNSLAASYRGPYAKIAESYDEEIESLTAERKTYVNDSTGVVRWSVKDGFDILTVLIGICGFAIIVLGWLVFIKHFKSIVEFETNVFVIIYYCFFSTLYCICCKALGYNYKKKSKGYGRKKNSDVVPFNKKRIG